MDNEITSKSIGHYLDSISLRMGSGTCISSATSAEISGVEFRSITNIFESDSQGPSFSLKSKFSAAMTAIFKRRKKHNKITVSVELGHERCFFSCSTCRDKISAERNLVYLVISGFFVFNHGSSSGSGSGSVPRNEWDFMI